VFLGERSLYLVVCVGHTLAVQLLTHEQVGQVEVYAVHRRAQASVSISRLLLSAKSYRGLID